MDTKKTGRRVIWFLLLFFASAYVVTSIHCGEPIRDVPANLVFRDGDIILFGSSTVRARFLKCIDGGAKWVHCGIAVAPNIIVHADPDYGVVRQTLDEYLTVNDVDCICQLRPYNGDGKSAALFAQECAEKKMTFDNTFSYKNGEGLYCTELVLLAWEAAGEEILLDVESGDRIMPSSLMETSRLYCVREL